MHTLPRLVLRSALTFGVSAALTLGLAACDSGRSGDPFDISDYTGAPYTGTVTLVVDPPGGASQTSTFEGTGQLTATSTGTNAGTVALVITVDAPDADPLTFNGTYDENGMRFTLPGTTATFTVDEDGDVSGSGRIVFFDTTLDVTADGTASSSAIDVDFDADVISGGTEEVPPGSEATVSFDLTR